MPSPTEPALICKLKKVDLELQLNIMKYFDIINAYTFRIVTLLAMTFTYTLKQ